ncbi:magnesium transport protein CorA [Oxobacter pfennigii]|uniref:Magnesium transport protein CorA n=1 Tax=Oxobacter pfennigii TaxID=36849 RepID=A0A0P8Z134_9CLOT|nr:magnesium/cobalt transporter CorA [Oxobacter pfennigii]KPU45843.1 magnesium transport protein CorA [Oxobacter pfennigii]
MIYTFAQTKDSEMLTNVPLERLSTEDINWYWIDFESPNEEEVALLSEHFKFDDLAIEDCLEHLERPKVDYYDTYNFFIFHALDEKTLEPIEVDLFVSANYVVSFHKTKLKETENVRKKILNSATIQEERSTYIAYLILDEIVDYYFPSVFRIEDSLSEIDIQSGDSRIHNLIDQVFQIRTDLLKLRHIINSMKELLYRVLNSGRLEGFKDNKRYFNDIYDHLLRLSDIVESNREVTSDVRDNYISINSHKMNKIMTILTVITSTFIPLTFIVGIYGMNFDYMPELRWRYGYFYVLGIMALIGIIMLLWFKRKGWFDIKK